MEVKLAEMKLKVTRLRRLGHTYGEINRILQCEIPKSTMSGWCLGIEMSQEHVKKIDTLKRENLEKARALAWKMNKQKRKEMLETIKKEAKKIAKVMKDKRAVKIALAMLCLGEASKLNGKHKSFTLGSSDPRIIRIFLACLACEEDFEESKLRFTVQCRADQDKETLERYWRSCLNINKPIFYKTRIDKRTSGKPTKNKQYMGVLVVDYYKRKTQLKLETLADVIYNHFRDN